MAVRDDARLNRRERDRGNPGSLQGVRHHGHGDQLAAGEHQVVVLRVHEFAAATQQVEQRVGGVGIASPPHRRHNRRHLVASCTGAANVLHGHRAPVA